MLARPRICARSPDALLDTALIQRGPHPAPASTEQRSPPGEIGHAESELHRQSDSPHLQQQPDDNDDDEAKAPARPVAPSGQRADKKNTDDRQHHRWSGSDIPAPS
jgi:hypothetical protein